MKSNSRGGILVVMLFLMVAFFWLALLTLNLGSAGLTQRRVQTGADMSVLSSLRLRIEALEKIAERWNEFGPQLQVAGGNGTVQLHSSLWNGVRSRADELARALPGYKGRTTAVIKVVAEANGIQRDQVEVLEDAGSAIGLVAESAVLQDENGGKIAQSGLWFRRLWGIDSRLSGPEQEKSRHRVVFPVTVTAGFAGLGVFWNAAAASEGRLKWDVARDDITVLARGNGGYPRRWDEGLENGRLVPHRWTVFQAELSRS